VSQREDLLRTIDSWQLSVTVPDDTSLIRSGLLDSLALFRLMLWVEEQTGEPLDPTRLDIREELDSVEGVLRYVAGQRHGGSEGA
jgi:acyl carrier protein